MATKLSLNRKKMGREKEQTREPATPRSSRPINMSAKGQTTDEQMVKDFVKRLSKNNKDGKISKKRNALIKPTIARLRIPPLDSDGIVQHEKNLIVKEAGEFIVKHDVGAQPAATLRDEVRNGILIDLVDDEEDEAGARSEDSTENHVSPKKRPLEDTLPEKLELLIKSLKFKLASIAQMAKLATDLLGQLSIMSEIEENAGSTSTKSPKKPPRRTSD